MRRALLIAVATTAIGASAASAAQAFSAYTGVATPGLATATVYGYVDTSNAETDWAFAYGRTSRYSSWSSYATIPAGRGTVLVAAVLTGLTPGVLYHYQLIAAPAQAKNPSDGNFAAGGDQWLTTERPRLELLSPTLRVRGGSSKVSLECVSLSDCRGTVSLSMAREGHDPGVSCATASFSIPAALARDVSVSLAGTCRKRLQTASGHRLKAVLNARPARGLPSLRSAVTVEQG